mmetsp:Transcript_21357/g.59183  ORF Transcript_21357/g.59183 Transcript_21357/m.59183 type:complete len:108 (+) Transcript_21357:4435-4758(+)
MTSVEQQTLRHGHLKRHCAIGSDLKHQLRMACSRLPEEYPPQARSENTEHSYHLQRRTLNIRWMESQQKHTAGTLKEQHWLCPTFVAVEQTMQQGGLFSRPCCAATI